MKIIRKIEIKYFRSIHSTKVVECKSLNIFSGRNDVGKSNVIKALNLFFNGISEYDSGFEFYENFSNKRLSEVRSDSVKGKQFISVSIEFIRPKSYRNSLPEFFVVERKWHRDSKTYDQKDNLATLEKHGKIPKTLASAQSSLTKFLNKIVFEYVPAIKDRNYFKNLLIKLQENLLHNSISDDEELTGSASSLASRISNQISELKSDFERATNVDTNIRPPSSISSLFQSFIISTSTEHGDIPLKYRGDGLQARYIASALNYYASKKSAFFIWGFEEPEIALEYKHASKLASDFDEIYSKQIQIFVTSHSPAFISLDSPEVSRYRVVSDNNESKVINIDQRNDTNHLEELQDELGIIDIQKEIHERYLTKLKELDEIREQISILKEAADKEKIPVVLTEGKTDKSILDTAYMKLFGAEPNFLIRACDNIANKNVTNGGCPNLAKMIESVHFEEKNYS